MHLNPTEPLVLALMNSTTEGAFSRLIKAMGREKALRVGTEALQSVGLRELRNQNDVLVFANALIAQGSVAEAVGRALKVSALLRGAVEKAA